MAWSTPPTRRRCGHPLGDGAATPCGRSPFHLAAAPPFSRPRWPCVLPWLPCPAAARTWIDCSPDAQRVLPHGTSRSWHRCPALLGTSPVGRLVCEACAGGHSPLPAPSAGRPSWLGEPLPSSRDSSRMTSEQIDKQGNLLVQVWID